MKRWGLRASYLSADTKANAGQKHSNNRLNPNVLYMMLCALIIHFSIKKIIIKIIPHIEYKQVQLCSCQTCID